VSMKARPTSSDPVIYHRELKCVVQPVLAAPVGVLRGDGQRVLLPREKARERERYLQRIAGAKRTEFQSLNTRIGSEHLNSKPVSDKNSNNRIYGSFMELGDDFDDDPVACPNN